MGLDRLRSQGALMEKKVTDLGRVSMSVRSSARGELTTFPYPDYLLAYAEHLLDADKPTHLNENLNHGLAVILAHTACEVAASRAYRNTWQNLGTAKQAALPLRESHLGHNLAVPAFRKSFKKVTGKDVTKIKHWRYFTAANKVRNKVIHSTHRATLQEAKHALIGAREIVAFLP